LSGAFPRLLRSRFQRVDRGITNHDRWVFTDGDGEPVHPHAVYEALRRIVHNAGLPTIRSS